MPGVEGGRAGSARSVRERRRCPRIFETMASIRYQNACESFARCKTRLLGFSSVICAGPDANHKVQCTPRTRTVEWEAGVLHYEIASVFHWRLCTLYEVWSRLNNEAADDDGPALVPRARCDPHAYAARILEMNVAGELRGNQWRKVS